MLGTRANTDYCWGRSAFTLVEMLIVIAIISTLAALLMPALQTAIGSARGSSCANQLRQIGMAFNLYTGDNRFYPPGGFTPASFGLGAGDWPYDDYLGMGYDGRSLTQKQAEDTWIRASWPDMDGPSKLYLCPTQPNWQASNYERSYAMPYAGQQAEMFYIAGTSARCPKGMARTGYPFSWNISRIRAPSKTILLAEEKGNPGDYKLGNTGGAVITDPIGQSRNYTFEPFHNRKWNYLFCDGTLRLLNEMETIGKNGSITANPEGMWSIHPDD